MSLPVDDKKKKKVKVPSFQEVMQEDYKPPKVPSYDEVMGTSEKKNPADNTLPTSSNNTSSVSETPLLEQEPIPIVTDYGNGEVVNPNDPIGMVKAADDFSKRGTFITGGSGTGGAAGSFSPDLKSIKASQEIITDLDKKGFKADFLIGIKDLPEDAFNVPETSKERLVEVYKENPLRFKQLTNEAKTKYAVRNAAFDAANENIPEGKDKEYLATQTAIIESNAYSGDEVAPLETMDDLRMVIGKKQESINRNISDEDTKRDLQSRLRDTYQSYINPESLNVREEYENSPLKNIVDINQFAGLETLRLFEPAKYDNYLKIIQQKITPLYSAEVKVSPDETQRVNTSDSLFASKNKGTLSPLTISETIGQETVLRELNAIGLGNEAEQLTSLRNDLAAASNNVTSAEEWNAIKDKYDAAFVKLDNLSKSEKLDDERYPTTAQLKYDAQVKEMLQDRGISVGGWMYNKYAHGVGTGVDAVENLVTTFFGSDKDKTQLSMKRIGEQQKFDASVYLPESERRLNSPVILQIPDDLKKEAKKILNGRDLSELSETERGRLNELMAKNQDKIQTITNPEAGKSKNFFSKATALTVGGFTSEIGAFLTKMALFRGMGMSAKAAEASTLFMDGYDHTVKQDLAAGKSLSEANEHGILQGGVLSLMVLFGSKYESVMNIIKGGKSPLSKQIAGMSEETWNAIYKQNESLINRLSKSTKNIAKEQVKMIGTFGVIAPTASALADNAFYNADISAENIVHNAAEGSTEMLIGSLGFIGFGLTKGALKPKATPLEKAALWELGDNPEIGKLKIDESVTKGDLTKDEGEIRKKTIDDISKLISKVPQENDKGKLLNDEQRIDYLYNLALKENFKKEAKDLPPKQAEKAVHKEMVADYENEILLDHTTTEKLEASKKALEKKLEQKDEEGKLVLADTELAQTKAKLEAVTNAIENKPTEVVAPEKTKSDEVVPVVSEVVGDNTALRDVESTAKALAEIEPNDFKGKVKDISDALKNAVAKEKERIQALGDKATEKEIADFFKLKEQSRQLGNISEFGSNAIKYEEIKNDFADVDNQIENSDAKYKRGKQIGEESFGKTYEADGDGILYRGVSKEDYKRIKKQGFIDTDLRGVISEKEGINLGKSPLNSANYLPNSKGGYVIAINPKGLKLFTTDADNYIRTHDNIPIENIVKVSEFIGKDEMGAMYKQSKFNEAISEAYHKAKKDGTNPELVKAVEQSLSTKQPQEGSNPALKDVESTGSSWQSNIEALVHPETGLAAVTKKILNEQQPLKDAFLKRIGLSIEDYRKLSEAEKQKVQDQWVKSKEFEQLSQSEPTNGKEQPQELKPEIKNEESKAIEVPDKETGDSVAEPVVSEAASETGGGKDKTETKELDKLANNVPDSGKITEYMSKDPIEKYTGETPINDQSRGIQELDIALTHGEKIIEEAKNQFGNEYVEKTLDYIENSTAGISNKALMYVSLENALGREKLANPDKAAELTKQQALVYAKSQAFARENSLALNYQKLRKIAQVGYDINKVTDSFFSAEELAAKKDIEKAIEADADTINKEAEFQETKGFTPEIEKQINEGVAKEIEKIYQQLPKEKKTAVDKAIAALESVQTKLRSKTYDATLGIPVAVIDLGITTIKLALKAGVKIADAIELGIAKIKDKYGKPLEKSREDEIRKDLTAAFSKIKTTTDIVKEALIEKGFGREITVKGANKKILDWKKLAGQAGTVEKIRENVEQALKDKKYTPKEIDAIKKELEQEYVDLRTSVIEKAQNELARRNKENVTADQKSAAKKLAELYTYGLFEEKAPEFETALNKALGAKVSESGYNEAKQIAKGLETIFSSSFKGVKLSDVSAKAAIEKLEDNMRKLLFKESKVQGNNNLKFANIVRGYFDIQQTMILNNLKQAVENPLSGLQQNLIDKILVNADGTSTTELANQRRTLMKSVYADMMVNGGIGYGKIENTFVNRRHIDDYVNKLSDNKLYRGIASVATGKATLNTMDAMWKAGITEKKFTSNLIKILTHETNKNRMGKEDAVKFVSEKLTGQTFKDAQLTAKTIIEQINKDAGSELISPNENQVNRFANDIVKASLEMGNKITPEQITAAYNAAYKSAGLGLGHTPNNFLSTMITDFSAKTEGAINEAIKNKEWNRAAMLTYKSILFRNVLNPFVGGGTNWLVLKLEKTGLGLFTGLGYQIGSKGKIDVGTELGMKRLEERLYNQARVKDNYMRGLVGGVTSLLTYAAFTTLANEDEYRKWRGNNRWAARYLDTITPEYLLAEMAIKDKKVERYVSSTLNKNDAFDASTKLIKSAVYFSKGDNSKAWGALGESIGSKINTPFPWRLAKDGQVIYQGIKGQDPYHGNYKPSEGFWSGALQGGAIEWLGGRPISESKGQYTPDELKDPTLKLFVDKGINFPEMNPEKIQTKEVNNKVVEKLSDYDEPTQTDFITAKKKYYKEGAKALESGGYEIYKDRDGEASYITPEQVIEMSAGELQEARTGNGKESVKFNDLTKEQLQYLSSQLGDQATEKTKKEIDLSTRKKKGS